METQKIGSYRLNFGNGESVVLSCLNTDKGIRFTFNDSKELYSLDDLRKPKQEEIISNTEQIIPQGDFPGVCSV